MLAYATGDAGAAATPRIVASAYTNSVAGATTTQLFDLDAGRDALVLQNPPNNGTLVSVGALGIDVGDNAGFDISAVDGVAYVSAQLGQSISSQLYTVNLTTGATTLVGRIGGRSPLRALAAAGTAPADTATPSVTLAKATASTKVGALLRTGVRLRATCSEGCTLSAQILSGSRVRRQRQAGHDRPGRLGAAQARLPDGCEEGVRLAPDGRVHRRRHRPRRSGEHDDGAPDAPRQPLAEHVDATRVLRRGRPLASIGVLSPRPSSTSRT